MVHYSPMGNYTKPPFSITESILKSVSEISERVGRLSVSANMDARPHLRRHYLEPAIREQLVSLTQPDKPTSRNQRYVRVS